MIISQKYSAVPATFFGMVLGIGGLSGAWRGASQIWGAPSWVGDGLALLAVSIWTVWTVLFCLKWIALRAMAQKELEDPVQSLFITLVPMATNVAAIALKPFLPTVALMLFELAVVAQICFTTWITGQLWMGGRHLEPVTAATYMPSVGGFFVCALASGTFAHRELGLMLWGAGFVSWLVWESVVLHRLLTNSLPVALRTTLGIHQTPPAVATAAYLNLTDGPPDLLVQALFGYAFFQGLVMLRIVNWLREQPFSPSAWAYTFGIAALPLAAIRFVERGQLGPIEKLALPLFLVANVAIGWIAGRTVFLAIKGKLIPSPVGQ